MPFIQSPVKVLLTGANGYYAVYVIKDLLERGYTVTGTVRSEPKGEDLAKLFFSYPGKFSYAVASCNCDKLESYIPLSSAKMVPSLAGGRRPPLHGQLEC